jgi:hypothetical protein
MILSLMATWQLWLLLAHERGHHCHERAALELRDSPAVSR